MPPWHLKPEALAILVRMKRPAIKHTSFQYPLTTDHFYEYEGRDVNRLTALFAMAIAERDAIVPYPADRMVTPSALLGALFGDPGRNSHMDTCGHWQAIRDEVGKALHEYIGEARQLQKQRQMECVA